MARPRMWQGHIVLPLSVRTYVRTYVRPYVRPVKFLVKVPMQYGRAICYLIDTFSSLKRVQKSDLSVAILVLYA